MDPLSITASIIAVIGAAGRASEGALFIIRVWKAAPDEILAIVNELSDIQLVLRSANDTLNLTSSADKIPFLGEECSSGLVRMLNRAQEALQELAELLYDKLLRVENVGEEIQVKFLRLRWVKERQNVRQLQTELRSLRANISALLSAISA